MSPALNRRSALQRFERDNTQQNNVQFLPGTAVYAPVLEGTIMVKNKQYMLLCWKVLTYYG